MRGDRGRHQVRVPAREPTRAAPDRQGGSPSNRRPEWLALTVATVAVVAAFTGEEWGPWGDVHAWLEPMSAYLEPALGPGLPLAVAVALLVAAHGPRLAEQLPWRRLLVATWLAGLAWSVGLALIHGWSGIAEPLTNEHEYLVDVPRVDDATELIPGFVDRIGSSPDTNWVTHVAGHPPLTFLGFVWLDRIGLGGPVWGGVVITLLGSTAVAAVLVTLRTLGDEARARVVAPYLALTPLVVWSVVSTDGVFAAAAGWGLALLASAAVAAGWRRAMCLGAVAGVALGLAINLSYGLVLTGTLVLAVLAAARSWRVLVPAALAALAVVGVFATLGFWWLAGQQELVDRYYRGIASQRPQAYWVWANLAIVCYCLGPAVVAAFGRVLAGARPAGAGQHQRCDIYVTGAAGMSHRRSPSRRDRPRWRPPRWPAAAWLALGAVAAIGVADASGLTRSEVERIWLPFMIWLVPLVAWLDPADRRRWLVAQAAWAIGISVILRYTW